MGSKQEKIWIPIIKRKGAPVLFYSYILTAYQDQYYQEILLLPQGIHDNKYLDGLVVLEANDAGILERTLAERLTPEYLSFFVTKCRHESDRLLATAREIRSQSPYGDMSNTDLAAHFTVYSSDAVRVMTFLTTIVVLERVLQKDLEKKLAEHCQRQGIKSDVKTFLSSLMLSQEKDIRPLAIIDLYNLGSDVRHHSSLRKLFDLEPAVALPQLRKKFSNFMNKFNDYLERYDFMSMEYYVGHPLLPEELFGRIKEVINDVGARFTRIREGEKRIKSEFKRVNDTLRLTPELKLLIETAQAIHCQRQYRADALVKAGRDVWDLATTIAERLNINYDSLLALTWSEIANSLINGTLTVAKETIVARQKGYGIRLIDGEQSIVTGEKLAEELAALPTVEKKAIQEIRGEIAFPGKYTGRVSVVAIHEEIDKVQAGDVLVSPMTDPYYVPALTRAGAIVTDEGGILSHAAIISRELGVPCIVGTRVATKTLQDGDIVEVNAEGEVGFVTKK